MLTIAALGAAGCEETTPTPQPTSESSAAAEGGPATGKKAAAKVDAAHYVVELEAAGPFKAGEKGAANVVLVPKGVYKVNDEYPMKLKLSDSDGVTYEKATLKKADFEFSPKKGTFAVAFTPAKAGKAKISGTLSMSVCSEENCLIEKVSLEKEIDVE